MQKLCADGHVIPDGREVCDRDGLTASTDEMGNPLTDATADAMNMDPEESDEAKEEAADGPKVDSEPSSDDSSASGEGSAPEAPAEEVAAPAPAEAPVEEAAPVEATPEATDAEAPVETAPEAEQQLG